MTTSVTPCRILFLMLVLALNLGPGTAVVRADSPYTVDFNNPPREYVTNALLGWSLWQEKELAEDHPVLASNAVARLERELGGLLTVLPKHSHALLKGRRLFLMLGVHSSLGGKNNGADYFQATAPRHFPKIDARMASSILIYSATNYVWLSDLWARKVLVHELAHAWQLEQWPEKHGPIMKAYRKARAKNLYHHVRRVDGALLEKAYAMTNQLEYFAELSCIYFVGCDYFPYNRDQLRHYDPAGYAMVESVWGVQE